MEIKLTDEQVAILDAIRITNDNILIEALAGTSKSTMQELAQSVLKGPCLYVAFAKSDAVSFGMEKDAFGKPTKKPKPILKMSTKSQTLNSLGYGVWGGAVANRRHDDKKLFNILSAMFSELKGNDKQAAWDQYAEIKDAVSMAKHMGYVPKAWQNHCIRLTNRENLEKRLENKLTPFAWALVDSALVTSIKAAYDGLIDFDDQIYMPGLFGGTFPRYPYILVDERQDLSPTNDAMLSKLCAESRVIAVGDRWQSIYYFRGAQAEGMDKMKADYKMAEYTLSTSFRCPRAIVEAARWRAPNFKWFKDGGKYEVLTQFLASNIPEGATIVCRNNAPLLRAAFALLSIKRSVQVVGSDISGKIVKLLGKIGAPGDNRETLMSKIDAWRDDKLKTSNAPATTNDTAECLKVFASWGNDVEQAINYANHIFKQQGAITLTTGHKAKGKEWDIVYHLDPHLLSKDEQDLNLKYVIQTRSKDQAYEITTEDTLWQ